MWGTKIYYNEVPIFPCSPEIKWLVPMFPKTCFLMFPVPQYCLCPPVPLKIWPLFPCYPEKVHFPKTPGRASIMVPVTRPRLLLCQYMVKSFKNLLLKNKEADNLGTWYLALEYWAYHVCLNAKSRFILTFLKSRSNLLPNAC